MSLINLQDCSRALVYGTNGKPLSEARVMDTGSNIYLFLSNSRLHAAHIHVPVDFCKILGVYRCECELDVRRNEQIGDPQEAWMAECRILKVAQVIQRQKCFRVQTSMPIIYSNDAKPFARGVIQNMSAGGIRLDTDEVMRNGTVFSYEQVLGDIPCEIKAQVVYGKVMPGRYRYGYGCRFIDLQDETLRAIWAWCHAHQKRKVRTYA